MKKISVIAIIIAGAGVLIYTGYYLFTRQAAVAPGSVAGSPAQGTDQEQGMNFSTTTAGQIVLPAGAPTGDTFLVSALGGSVKVKNFYKTAIAIIEADQVVIATEANYELDYSMSGGNFSISVAVADRNTRLAAENELVGRLGVSQADACRLKVEVLMPKSDPAPLSFCGGTL